MKTFLCCTVLFLVSQIALGQEDLRRLQSKEWTWDRLDKEDGSWNRIYMSFGKLDGTKKINNVLPVMTGQAWIVSCKETKDGRTIIQSSKGTYWYSKMASSGDAFSVICNFDQNLWFDSQRSDKGWVSAPEIVPKRYCVEMICNIDDDLSEMRTIAQQAYPCDENDGQVQDPLTGRETLAEVHNWKTTKDRRNVIPLVSSKRSHSWLKKNPPEGFNFKE